MNKLTIIFILNLFALPLFAVVNGHDLTPETEFPFVGIDISIEGVYGSAPCSGTYIGNGKILTAGHCFLLSEYETENVSLCISNAHKTENFCVSKDEYKVALPPVAKLGPKAPTRKTRRVIQIPKPDLALVTIHPNRISFLNKLIPAELDYSALDTQNNLSPLMIFGQGCTNYASFGEAILGVGIFRFGLVQLQPDNDPIDWLSKWTRESNNAGVCWGDSGGALAISEDQKIKLKGVVSSMKTTHDPKTGAPAEVKSFFGKLNSPEITKWLTEQMKLNN